ncbi:helix-turn-helix domain-containing protein [Streptomyces sp. 549]|uniref:helix-turn-helix domain-containing protein n=1 Tax=Streptomyces sp. 549 TaxID=3049076 RepID=UPI0024C45592|nr:helix-turn-helix domain-containing protein [Streptomyces sp. 549]MDK1476212.1 helix-turn-helix domain-containing protein [Streptomyces sp. 549]
MASLNPGDIGEFLREQRRSAQLSLRQLADAAGVSNPYLSQIERGLRKPSAEILQQLAKALRISAETLYVRAGMLEEREPGETGVVAAVLADPSISDQQKQALLQIYESFRTQHGSGAAPGAAPQDPSAAPPSKPSPQHTEKHTEQPT